MSRADRASRWKYRAYRLAAHIPKTVWWPLGQVLSWMAAWRRPTGVRRWIDNAQMATGNRPGPAQISRAVFSWWRNTVLSLQLGRLSPDQILDLVEIDEERFTMLLGLHTSRGLVLALPHMGSWDLAGAFACVRGLPVTSVAERLPAGAFEYFAELRHHLGFEIYPYDQADLISVLSDDISRGRTICLVADRDFSRRGIAVVWPGGRDRIQMTLPPGPAVIAQRSGAALVPVWCAFTRRGMRIVIGDPITVGPGGDGVAQATQTLAETFAGAVRQQPGEWHMMQRFFPSDKDAR